MTPKLRDLDKPYPVIRPTALVTERADVEQAKPPLEEPPATDNRQESVP